MRCLLLLFCCFPFLCFAQTRPIILPEDIAPSSVGLRCYCKPGVINQSRSRGIELSYKVFGPAVFEGEGQTLSEPLSRIDQHRSAVVKLKVPLVNKEGFKLLLGYNYLPERYNLDRIGVDYSEPLAYLDGTLLKSNAFSALIVRPFSDRVYLTAQLKFSTNGDYSGWMNWNNRYLVVSSVAGLGFKKEEGTEWGVGVALSKSFRRTNVIPFVMYNRNFNDQWGIESVLPAFVLVRYNLDMKTILLAGVEYSSRSFAISVDNGISDPHPIYHLNHSEMESVLRIERMIVPWIWLNIDGGYQLNFSTDFNAKDGSSSSFMLEPKDNIFFRIGVFISPPDSMMR